MPPATKARQPSELLSAGSTCETLPVLIARSNSTALASGNICSSKICWQSLLSSIRNGQLGSLLPSMHNRTNRKFHREYNPPKLTCHTAVVCSISALSEKLLGCEALKSGGDVLLVVAGDALKPKSGDDALNTLVAGDDALNTLLAGDDVLVSQRSSVAANGSAGAGSSVGSNEKLNMAPRRCLALVLRLEPNLATRAPASQMAPHRRRLLDCDFRTCQTASRTLIRNNSQGQSKVFNGRSCNRRNLALATRINVT